MRHVTLGSLEVGRIGLGAMSMSGYYGSADLDEAESVRTIHRALEVGVTLLDTAEAYGPYLNEELVGRAVKGRREQVVLATKFGLISHGHGGRALDSSPGNIRTALEGSLRRLGTDRIDLYYQHRVDPNTPIEEVAGTLGELVAEGKIRHYGLSEAGPETIARAHAVHPVTAVQSEYSLWTRDQEPKVLPLLERLGIGFVAYSPLGRGFLTGQIRSRRDFGGQGDARSGNPRFAEGNFEHNLRLLEQVELIAAEAGATPGQVALAWLLTRGGSLAPIPGTRHVGRLEENAAADALELTPAQIDTLSRLAQPAGDHHPQNQMSQLER